MDNLFKEVLKTHLSTPYSQLKIKEKGLTFIKSKIKSLKYYYDIDQSRNKTLAINKEKGSDKIWSGFKTNLIQEFKGVNNIKN